MTITERLKGMADFAIDEKRDCWGGIAVLKARRRLLVILCEFGCLINDLLSEVRAFYPKISTFRLLM